MFKLKLRFFRCFKNKEIVFQHFPLIIIGPNGSGKTSILEAIYFLATSKSFRTRIKNNLISFRSNQAYICLDLDHKKLEIIFYKTKPTIYRINGKKIGREKFINQFLISVFWWGDFRMIYGTPQDRRRFLNLLCLQQDSKYLQWLIIYKKMLKERNFALRKNDLNLIKIWDKKLSFVGNQIYLTRKKVIANINKKISFFLSFFRPGKGKIVYYHNYLNQNDFLKKLSHSLEKDILLGSTSVGPHRDDLKFFWGNKSLNSFSQGEIKAFLLSLKLSFFEKDKKINKFFLIDDSLTGLDKTAAKNFISLIQKQKIPLILTSQNLPLRFEGQVIRL